MSDAQKLTQDVLRKHRIAYLDQFICSFCGTTFDSLHDADAHQAAEIDKAFGGLTREFASGQIVPGDADYTVTDGSRGSSRSNADKCLYFPRFKLIERWVSGWSEAQP